MSKYVIFIPGGFKPPTIAHYEMIRKYSEWPSVVKTVIVQTSHVREGFGPESTKKVFDWYGGFNDKVEYIMDKESKRGAIEKVHRLVNDSSFTSKYPPSTIYAMGSGNKGKDANRVQDFLIYYEKRPEALQAGIKIGKPPFVYEVCTRNGENVSSSALREALRTGDDVKVGSLIPRHRSPRNFPRNFSS
jgi:hypothetical protein